MSSLNKTMLIGHLGRDPETRYMPNGEAVTNIAIATTESWKDKTTGEKKEATEWHRVTFYRKLAEIAGQYLKKGSLVYVEGKLQTRKWTDKDGVERYTTEVIVDQMQMLGGRPAPSDDAPAPAPRQAKQEARQPAASQSGGQRQMADMDDDIPFNNPYRGKYAFGV